MATALIALAVSTIPAMSADRLTVVALGASNTSGWGVGEAAAYPARLAALLRALGHDIEVLNAGRPFDTTGGMLARLDSAVPPAADLVVIQPGGNDLRFFGTRERRQINIDAMVARLNQQGVRTIVYDPVFPPQAYQWDGIHLTADWHGRIAQELLPPVLDGLIAARVPTESTEPVRQGRMRGTR